MNQEIIDLINNDFKETDRAFVIEVLSSLCVIDVMADSPVNLAETLRAIIKLSYGETRKVVLFTGSAKTDFRDVLWWASQEKVKSEN